MKILKELIPYVIILIVVVLIRSFIATPIKVDGKSMYPTLNGNEVMILNKLGKIDRYDVVVIETKPSDIIKRVIALPNETIEIKNNTIYVNGKKIDDKYGDGETSDYDKITLKDNEYFVLGDNRENSKDSRVIGPIDASLIKGTTKFVLFPFTKFGNIK